MHRHRKLVFGAALFVAFVGAVPVLAAEGCTLTNLTTIQLGYDRGGRPIIPVMLNDVERHFLIDTGGAYGMLDAATANILGLRAERSATTIRGVTGQRSSTFYTIEDFRFGTLRAQNQTFMVWPRERDPDGESAVVGTIAPDILAEFDTEFDFGSGRFSLFRHNNCTGAPVYWPADAIAMVPFELNSSWHITFPILLDGVELTAIIDTGAAPSTLRLDIAEDKFGLNASTGELEQVSTLGEQDDPVFVHEFQSIRMGDVEVFEPHVTILPDLMSSEFNRITGTSSSFQLPDMIIGMSILSHLRIYIAYGEKRLYVTEAVNEAPAGP